MANLLMEFPMWELTFADDPNKSVSLANSVWTHIWAACQERKETSLAGIWPRLCDMEEQFSREKEEGCSAVSALAQDLGGRFNSLLQLFPSYIVFGKFQDTKRLSTFSTAPLVFL